ncbi:MAG: hypothetical protein HYY04_05935 [Chloroflexi bacterium]|nr:hypothetical protein [Chloroflexota bacterium]
MGEGAIGTLLTAVVFVLLYIAPPYCSYHLARRKGRSPILWPIAAVIAAIPSMVGGWVVFIALLLLPNPDLHPDV